MKPRILVIDDEVAIRDSLRMILEYERYECLGAGSGPEGLSVIARDAPDMVILDIKMPGMSGLDTLAEIRTVDATVPIAMISGHGTITDAVQATQLGAFDFIEKPFTSERVLVTVKKGLEVRELRQENRELKLAMESKYEMIGESPALRTVLESVKRAAPTSATVLLLGESGVGKELVARTIHRNSPRAGQRFVQVNCAAIPEELIESELFGHEKGSFTGATEKQIGKFEQADQGTIFLDEIGDMSPKTQAKVLRVLQEQEVERLGSVRTIKLDVRVIAATNKNLEESIARGEFRDDLYFRLNVIPITVPPLRERRDDIERLANYFAKRISQEQNLKPRRFDARAMQALRAYRWRGNIRELRNTVERLMIMSAGDTVRFEDLPTDMRGGGAADDASSEVGRGDAPSPEGALEAGASTGEPTPGNAEPAGTLREFKDRAERAYLVQKLRENRWNISKTAEGIDTPRSNLYKKLEQYGIKQELDG
ncbi:MAG: sigma-54 dependent transcriptional regulator [Acidobacteria bacterium]|nr:sigma-54 dependent transcriptional regulator [Acidobacteriota bacterium]